MAGDAGLPARRTEGVLSTLAQALDSLRCRALPEAKPSPSSLRSMTGERIAFIAWSWTCTRH